MKAKIEFEIEASTEGEMRGELQDIFRHEAHRAVNGGKHLTHWIRDTVGNPVGRIVLRISLMGDAPAAKPDYYREPFPPAPARGTIDNAREVRAFARAIFEAPETKLPCPPRCASYQPAANGLEPLPCDCGEQAKRRLAEIAPVACEVVNACQMGSLEEVTEAVEALRLVLEDRK